MRMLVINKMIHCNQSYGRISNPDKLSSKHTGHKSNAFKNPIIVNVNATCPSGGSAITFLNITYNQN